MNMNQKGFANIILAIVIVVLLGAVGYFAFVKRSEPVAQQPTPTVTTTSSASVKKSPTPIKTVDPMAGWKTYTNTQYGFEFKYPNEFKITNISPVSINWSWEPTKEVPWPLRLGVISNSDGKTIEQYILTEPSHKDFPYNIVEKNYSANGINGTIVSDPITMGENEYEFFWGNGPYIFKLSSTDLPRLKIILSTLKFTN